MPQSSGRVFLTCLLYLQPLTLASCPYFLFARLFS